MLNCSGPLGIPIWGIEWWSLVIIVGLVVIGVKQRNWAYAIIVIGGIGNWWQRWQNGCVLDNLIVPIFGWQNNVWDWMIVVGSVIVIWQIWNKRHQK